MGVIGLIAIQLAARSLRIFSGKLQEKFQDVIRLIGAGRIDMMLLIMHRFKFAETAARLPLLHREPELVKTMIDFD